MGISSKGDCRDEGAKKCGRWSTFIRIAGNKRPESRVCDELLLHGKQPASKTDGGSSKTGMCWVGEYSSNW